MSAVITGITDAIQYEPPLDPPIAPTEVTLDCDETFPYTLAPGATLTCSYSTPMPSGGSLIFDASFVTNDLAKTGSDSWTITIDVPCAEGCWLAAGYWKTHSSHGPAPYDDTWAALGENTAFFLSGMSYYQALWTPPAGNAYFVLARAYIAAKLNGLHGADFGEARAAFDQATALFQTFTPGAIAAARGKDGFALRSRCAASSDLEVTVRGIREILRTHQLL